MSFEAVEHEKRILLFVCLRLTPFRKRKRESFCLIRRIIFRLISSVAEKAILIATGSRVSNGFTRLVNFRPDVREEQTVTIAIATNNVDVRRHHLQVLSLSVSACFPTWFVFAFDFVIQFGNLSASLNAVGPPASCVRWEREREREM
jgi:hypothetical protein